ncbi:MAG TPA: hypothetical protein VF526_01410 [Solirubrobacteraceae bacterium]
MSDRAQQIRRRLHDPRYDEPILLALGLIGRDYAEDIEKLFETALLATTEEAQRLGLQPSPLEELLGRDFRFARSPTTSRPRRTSSTDFSTKPLTSCYLRTGRGRFARCPGML